MVSRFVNESHLGYYYTAGRSIRCGVKSENLRSDVKVKYKETNKLMKKRSKLLKNLSRDLFTMTQIGLGLDSAEGAVLLDREQEEAISGAAEALLAQLQKLKTKLKDVKCEDSSSSSSSSESSDSECEGSSNMNGRMHKAIVQSAVMIPDLNPVINQESIFSLSKPMKGQRIEVCLGGKCKKSGAQAILENLQNAVGIQGAVCGSKCMGKCKMGPNVRLSGVDDELRLGVGIHDVSSIASAFLGEKGKELVPF